MNSLKNRLNKYAASAAAVTAAVAVTGPVSTADAAIVHSGIVNQTIAATINGLYLNVVTGQVNEPGNGPGSTVPGWDVNFWSSTGFGLFNASGTGGSYVLTSAGVATNMAPGATIGAGLLYGSGTSSNTSQWNLNSDQNIVGFRFINEANGNAIHYGWARISFGATVTSRSLVEYAYEDVAGTSIAAGAVPAPAALALMGMGGLVAGRRRR